jgi:hypothetical protein
MQVVGFVSLQQKHMLWKSGARTQWDTQHANICAPGRWLPYVKCKSKYISDPSNPSGNHMSQHLEVEQYVRQFQQFRDIVSPHRNQSVS